jgi:hypothetical protein
MVNDVYKLENNANVRSAIELNKAKVLQLGRRAKRAILFPILLHDTCLIPDASTPLLRCSPFLLPLLKEAELDMVVVGCLAGDFMSPSLSTSLDGGKGTSVVHLSSVNVTCHTCRLSIPTKPPPLPIASSSPVLLRSDPGSDPY